MKNKKTKRIDGNIVKITLEDGSFSFARVLEEPLMAFYELKTNKLPTVEEIVRLPILFKIWVMNDAITTGTWEVIGYKELENSLKEPVRFFKQDPISKSVCLYVNLQKALEEAKKRLNKALPDIEKRQQEAAQKVEEEPDYLRSGVSIDELEVKRAMKEQENEDPI